MSKRVGLKVQVLKAAEDAAGLACFCIIRNERYFLPHLLGHYRALGVAHFIFYDDGSDDGGLEYLFGEPDCTILISPYAFREPMADGRPFHYLARTAYPEHFAEHRWCVVVDADEFMLLPRRFASLPALIEELESRGEIAVQAAMIDLYPATLRERNYVFDLGPFEAGPWWFDPDPLFASVVGKPEPRPLPAGLRHRLAALLLDRYPARHREVYGSDGHLYRPCLWKVPLVKLGQGITRPNTHSIDKPVAQGIQLGLAHFKFHPATDAKIRDALERKSYARESAQYRLFEALIDCLEDEPLVNERSVPFRCGDSFEEAGLMFG
jgi:hypothetical protein